MTDLGDPHATGPSASSPLPGLGRRRRGRGGSPRGPLLAGLLLVAAGLVAWWLLRDRTPEPPPSAAVPESMAPQLPPPGADPEAVPPLDLPELGASDEFVRRLVSALSARPQLAAYLATDALVDRFIGVVIDLAGGSTPAAHLRHMAPSEGFSVRSSGGRTVADPASHARFDAMAATFASLDTPGTVRLYRQLLPLLEEAYAAMGIPDITFEETLALAIRNVLAVEIPTGELEVVADEAVYVYADPAIEARRGLAKQLLRMGPDNALLVQAKMREFAQALGIDANP